MRDPRPFPADMNPFNSTAPRLAHRLEELREIGDRLEGAIAQHALVVERLPAQGELAFLDGEDVAKLAHILNQLQSVHEEFLGVGRQFSSNREEMAKTTAVHDRQDTLVEELNHRIRNILTIVASVARQTLDRTSSLEEFAQSFLGRIQSLARTYTVTARDKWVAVDLHALLQAEFKSYSSIAPGQIYLDGPTMSLKPHAALAMALVVHELTTNAIKYGALSSVEGRIAISWLVSEGPPPCLRLVWHETATQISVRDGKGLGSVLIDREIRLSLKGTVDVKHVEDCLCVEASIPLSWNIIAHADAVSVTATSGETPV